MDEATGLDEAPGLDEATDGVPDLSLRRGLRLLPALTVLLLSFVVDAWAAQLDSPHTRVRPRDGPRTTAAPCGGGDTRHGADVRRGRTRSARAPPPATASG